MRRRRLVHVRDGVDRPDHDGMDVPDLCAARAEALRLAGGIIRDAGIRAHGTRDESACQGVQAEHPAHPRYGARHNGARLRGPAAKRDGPTVIAEAAGLPRAEDRCRQEWRNVADAAGLPRAVLDMDARSGGATEADAARSDVQRGMRHSDLKTTSPHMHGNALEQGRRVAAQTGVAGSEERLIRVGNRLPT